MTTKVFAALLGVLLALFTVVDSAHAGAGDSQYEKEVGTWAIHDYSAVGLGNLEAPSEAAGFAVMLYAHSVYNQWDQRTDNNCKERHLRDPQFYLNGYYGNDSYSFDAADIGFFAGHGNSNIVSFNTNVDAYNFEQQYARWGNYDLEWVYVDSCHVAGSEGNPNYLLYDLRTMAGLHSWHGFTTEAPFWDADSEYDKGTNYVFSLIGYMDGSYHTWRFAWKNINDLWIGSGYTLRAFFGASCENEYLPGYGSYQTTDPTAFVSGGTVWYENTDLH